LGNQLGQQIYAARTLAHCAGRCTTPCLRAAGERVFRTYFINGRGDEEMGTTWNYLDITALGRQEEWEDSPKGYSQTPPYEWWIWHDDPNPDSDRPGLVQLRAFQASLKGQRRRVTAHEIDGREITTDSSSGPSPR
jgi:hypothetical protein